MVRAISLLILAAAAIGLTITLISFAREFGSLPAVVPTHFNAFGFPDAYGGKGILVLFPMLASLFFGIIVVISTLGMPSSRGPAPPALCAVVSALFAESIWMLNTLQSGTFKAALGQSSNLGVAMVDWIAIIIATTMVIVGFAIAVAIRRD